MTTPKRIGLAIVLIALAAAAGWWWWQQRSEPAPTELTLYGNVDIRQVALAFNASERIAELSAAEGDRVKAGQVLGRLETRTATLRLAQADAQLAAATEAMHRLQAGSRPEEVAQSRANVAAAQADVDQAQTVLNRLRSVHEATGGRGVSQADLDSAASRLKAAQARMESVRKGSQLVVAGPRREDIAQARAQRDVAAAERALLAQQIAESELRAPIDAVVRARLLEPGEIASPQRPVFTLAITHPKWVRAYVPETRLASVRPGMAATVSVDDGAASMPITGQVGYIASVAEFTPKTVQTEELRTSLVYEIRVRVVDPDDRLRLGMPATVHIALPSGAAATPARR